MNPEEMQRIIEETQRLSDRYVQADTPEGANASAKNAADALPALLKVARELLAAHRREDLGVGDG